MTITTDGSHFEGTLNLNPDYNNNNNNNGNTDNFNTLFM